MPNQYVGDLLLTIEISGLYRVRTEVHLYWMWRQGQDYDQFILKMDEDPWHIVARALTARKTPD